MCGLLHLNLDFFPVITTALFALFVAGLAISPLDHFVVMVGKVRRVTIGLGNCCGYFTVRQAAHQLQSVSHNQFVINFKDGD